jgi:solute:Na+ symporter, SSS family
VILVIATLLALWFTRRQLGVFVLIQNIGAWVAAPISAVFLMGVLWRRATAEAATFVLWFGFPFTALVEYVIFKHVEWLRPYDNWLNRTFVVWVTSLAAMVIVSWCTPPPPPEKLDGIVWSPGMAALPDEERRKHRGIRSLFLWWAIFVCLMLALYAYMIWFQFWGSVKGS